MIQSYGVGFNAGQAMIMEDVNGMCDRVYPFRPSEVASSAHVLRTTVDTVIGFMNDKTPSDGTGLLDGTTNAASATVSP
jgi:hypothetical protein